MTAVIGCDTTAALKGRWMEAQEVMVSSVYAQQEASGFRPGKSSNFQAKK